MPLRIAILLCVLALPAGSAAALPEAVDVRVIVRAGEAKPAAAYVAFVAPDHPMHRPSAERILPLGTGTFGLAPGTYRAIVGAPGYQDRVAPVRVLSARDVRFELEPEVAVHGSVVDVEGRAIEGARVSHARLAGPVALVQWTELARGLLAGAWSTRTDRNGRWTLPGHSDGTLPLLVESEGYAPALVTDPAKPCVLRRGGSMAATLDRVDPDLVVTLIPSEESETTLPSEWQPRVYARRAGETPLRWPSIAAGRYRVLARYLDPRRFADSAALTSVTITAGDAAAIRLELPPRVEPMLDPVVLFLPGKSLANLVALRASRVTAAGESEGVRHAAETSSGGALVYLRTSAAPQHLLLVTSEFLAGGKAFAARPSMDAPGETVISPRAEATLRFESATPELPSPRWTLARFDECSAERDRFTLALPVARDGTATMPFPAACHSLVLQQPPFEPLVIDASIPPGEKRALGNFLLRTGAAAEIRVVRDPAGTPAAGASVRILHQRPNDWRKRVVAEGVADVEGRVLLRGLPAGAELVAQASDPGSELFGSTTVTLAAGTIATINPLRIPLPAKVTFALRLGAAFRERFPDARIRSITLDRDAMRGTDERRMEEVSTNGGAIQFDRLSPGRWQPHALLEAAGSIQPVPLEALELAAGEERRVETAIEPLVVHGRVLAAGEAVAAQVGLGEPPARGSVMRFARSDAQGRFTIILPASGIYSVRVTRLDRPDERIDLGELDLRDSGRAIELTIPPATLLVRVRDSVRPVAGVPVKATLSRSALAGGVVELARTETTNADGEARFEALHEGRWTIDVRETEQRLSAQTSLDVAADESRVLDVELKGSLALAGFVHDPNDAPIADASVDCLIAAAGTVPTSEHAQTDTDGHFSMQLRAGSSPLFRCGVTTRSGAIAAYAVAPTQSADFRLSRDSGSLLIPDWGRRLRRNVVWLVARDGRIFNLSWASGTIGRQWSPLAISRVPAGTWNLVTITDLDDWIRLGNGDANGLAAAAELSFEPGQTRTVSLEADHP